MPRAAVPARAALVAVAAVAVVVAGASSAGAPAATPGPAAASSTGLDRPAPGGPAAPDTAATGGPAAMAPVAVDGRPFAGPADPPLAAPSAAAAQMARRERAVRRAVAAALRGRRGTVEVAITDVTGRQVVLVGAGRPVRTASIVKLLVLRAALARGPLGRTDRALARAMITRSDNAATTTLWRRAGGDPAVARAAAALGMKHTTRLPVLFQPWDGWQTTAADQARLLRAIATGRDAGSRSTRTLMAQVVPEQAWGVGAVAGATGAKNGWVPVGRRWVVNSDGCVTRQRVPLCLSVLTTGSRTFAEGIGTVERAAAAAVRAWA